MIRPTDKQIKEMADNLQSGMISHYNFKTGEILVLPDPDSWDEFGDHREFWGKDYDKLHKNAKDYESIEKMHSSESFRIMEAFVDTVPPRIGKKLEEALRRRKPFRNFKYAVDNSSVRQDWFKFRDQRYIEWVENHFKPQLWLNDDGELEGRWGYVEGDEVEEFEDDIDDANGEVYRLRRLQLYIAQSLDGYIARENGEVDWLSFDDPEGYGYPTFDKSTDVVLMGYKTYRQLLRLAKSPFQKGKTYYVFTKKHIKQKDNKVTFINTNPADFITELNAKGGQDILIIGGSEIIHSLLEDGVIIDHFSIFIIPILLGKGILLFKSNRREESLSLYDIEDYPNGMVKLQYRIKR